MKYLNVEDVKEITGASKSKSYKIIRELRAQYQKRFPDSISIQGLIPKWYFEEAMGLKEEKESESSEKA